MIGNAVIYIYDDISCFDELLHTHTVSNKLLRLAKSKQGRIVYIGARLTQGKPINLVTTLILNYCWVHFSTLFCVSYLSINHYLSMINL